MLLPYRNTDGSFHQATEVDFYKFSSIKFRGWSLHAKFSSQHKDLVAQISFSITWQSWNLALTQTKHSIEGLGLCGNEGENNYQYKLYGFYDMQ